MSSIFWNEWRGLLRDGRGRLVFGLGVLLAALSAWASAATFAAQEAAQAAAASLAAHMINALRIMAASLPLHV